MNRDRFEPESREDFRNHGKTLREISASQHKTREEREDELRDDMYCDEPSFRPSEEL